MSTKKYRRRINEFVVIDTRSPDLERGPIVTLDGDDGTFDVPLKEFESEFEEVPESQGEDQEAEGVETFLRDTAKSITADLNREDASAICYFHVGGRHASFTSVRRLRAILDAARRGLAAKPTEDAGRCRVGETMWRLGKYFPVYAGKGQADFVQCDCDDDQERESSRVTFHFYNRIHGYLTSGQCSRETWDDAHAKWIADGRPSS